MLDYVSRRDAIVGAHLDTFLAVVVVPSVHTMANVEAVAGAGNVGGCVVGFMLRSISTLHAMICYHRMSMI